MRHLVQYPLPQVNLHCNYYLYYTNPFSLENGLLYEVYLLDEMSTRLTSADETHFSQLLKGCSVVVEKARVVKASRFFNSGHQYELRADPNTQPDQQDPRIYMPSTKMETQM